MIPLGDPLETLEYTLQMEAEKPEDDRTVWILGGLDIRQRCHVRSAFDKEGPAALHYWLCKCGLRGWRNFGEAQFATEKTRIGSRDYELVADACLDRIPDVVMVELGNRITERMSISEEDRKN